jgi:hypothetical protein
LDKGRDSFLVVAEEEFSNNIPSFILPPIDVQNQEDELNKLGQYRSSLYDLLGSIDYVREHQDYPNMTDLNNAAHQISGLINQVYQAATTCFNDYHSCNLGNTDLPTVNFPSLQPGATPPLGEAGIIQIASRITVTYPCTSSICVATFPGTTPLYY